MLSKEEQKLIWTKMRGKNLPMIEESIDKLEKQAWQAIGNNELAKGQKCFEIVMYIKSIITALAKSF